MPGVYNRLQANGGTLPRGIIAPEPFAVRFDRRVLQFQYAGDRIFGAARFVEAEVAVLSEAEHDDIQSAGIGNAALVFLHAGERVTLQRTHSEVLCAWNAPRVGNRTTEQVRAIARLFERHAHVFVEDEEVQLRQR